MDFVWRTFYLLNDDFEFFVGQLFDFFSQFVEVFELLAEATADTLDDGGLCYEFLGARLPRGDAGGI